MSKRTSYGKIYHLNVRFVRTSADVRARPRLPYGRIFTRRRVLSFPPTVKNASARTRPYVRVDGQSVRVDAPMRPRRHRRVRANELTSLPSPSLCTPSLALCGQADASAQTRRGRAKKIKK
jgi:hypothetical protein